MTRDTFLALNVDCGHAIGIGHSRAALAPVVDRMRAAGNHAVRLRHLGRDITAAEVDRIRADILAGLSCPTCKPVGT